MTAVPDQLRYTEDHEWVLLDGELATVGITAFAAEQLGDIVFVQLPAVGDRIEAGSVCGELESTKSVSDLFAPVNGEVIVVNEELVSDPALANAEPFGAGWLFKVRPDAEPAGLLTATEYTARISS